MKKIFAIAALALGISAAAIAQPKAIGGRFGYGPLEVSYEHCVGSPNFFEFELGASVYDLSHDAFGFQATAMYNFVFAQPNWTSRGEWEWYAGPGITTGWLGDDVYYKDEHGNSAHHWDSGFMLGIAGQVGLSYTFWFPLQLSVDFRPVLGLHANKGWTDDLGNKYGNKVGFYNQGFTWCWLPTLSVRYAF